MYEKIKNLQRQRTFIDKKIVKLEAEAGTAAITRIAELQNKFQIRKHNAIAGFIKQLERFVGFFQEASKNNQMVKYLKFEDSKWYGRSVSMSPLGVSRICIYCIDERFPTDGNQKAYTDELISRIQSEAHVYQFEQFAGLLEATNFDQVADAWEAAQEKSNDTATILI